jgi:hypothetical protein
MGKIDYDFLWHTLQTESKNRILNPLPVDFYKEAEALAATTTENINNNVANNITTIISKIKEIRTHKLLLYIAYKKQIQQPIPIEEQEIYEKIILYISERQPIKKQDGSTLNTIQTVPEIYLPSGGKIGPLSKGEKITIKEKNDAEFLINSLICEYV